MDGFPELTFGGMKQTGQGREIGSYGLDEFLEIKTVVLRVGRTRANWVRDRWAPPMCLSSVPVSAAPPWRRALAPSRAANRDP